MIVAAELRRSRNPAGIDRTYVSALERGRYAASVDVIERLAFALNVDPASLLDRNGVAIDVETIVR